MRARKKSVSDDLLIADLKRILQIAPRLTVTDLEKHGKYAAMTYRSRWGSMDAIRQAAGWKSDADPELARMLEELSGWSELQCVVFLRAFRWPAGIACPRCEERDSVAPMASQQLKNREIALYECRDCAYQFSDISKTCFHQSSASVKSWFFILCVFLSCGTPRSIGVTAHLYRYRVTKIKDSAFARNLGKALVNALREEGGR